jgi:hypothetical protein
MHCRPSRRPCTSRVRVISLALGEEGGIRTTWPGLSQAEDVVGHAFGIERRGLCPRNGSESAILSFHIERPQVVLCRTQCRLRGRVVHACQPGQLDPRVDVQLDKDMAKMTADGVMGDEEALSHFAIREPLSN